MATNGNLTDFAAGRAVRAGLNNATTDLGLTYLALVTALPATPATATLADWVANEITTTGYSRRSANFGGFTGTPPEAHNVGAVTFGPFTADPPPVSHAFLCDAASGSSGNVLAWWEFAAPVDLNASESLVLAIGNVSLTLG